MVFTSIKFTTTALQRPTTTMRMDPHGVYKHQIYNYCFATPDNNTNHTGLVRAGNIIRKALRGRAAAETSMHFKGRPAVQHNCSRLSGTAARGCWARLLAVVGIAKHAAGRSQQCIQRLTQQHTQLSCAKKTCRVAIL